jgi:hypothetical protein
MAASFMRKRIPHVTTLVQRIEAEGVALGVVRANNVSADLSGYRGMDRSAMCAVNHSS